MHLCILANYNAERREKDARSPGTNYDLNSSVVLSRQIMLSAEQGERERIC